MKTVQKLEIAFGLATLISTLIVFFISVSPAIRKEISEDRWNIIYGYLFWGFLLHMIPAFSIGISAFVHARRQSGSAFIILLLSGAVLVLVFGASFPFFAVYLGWLGGLIFSAPGFLAAFTIILAFRSRRSL